ncbi:MAG: outer membrane beta-barrel protein [Opitutaceae bacterium]|nr:outer membrane beta-barrel protein [Opitutaceae bacterium]
MPALAFIRSCLAVLLGLLLLAGTPAHALVSIDDGKNQLFIVGSASYMWDSNIFASAGGGGDSIYTATVGLEFKRRAGLIGVDASLFLDASKFVENTGENFQNPRFKTEFTKQSGRTTGSLTLGAARESRADTAANLRNESWTFDAGLNFKYPIIERYSISGGFGYALRDFNDNTILVDLATYSFNADLFYVYNSERDLIAGYRLRYSESSGNTGFYDHAFTLGVSGKILPKLGGTLRFGYQFREPTNSLGESSKAFTIAGSTTWNLTKQASSTLSLAKDFSTTSTNVSVDTSTATLDTQYALNSRMAVAASAGYGINEFLGSAGGGREDQFFTGTLGTSFTVNQHLNLSLTYVYFQNWSNFSFSDFIRNSVTLTAASKF